MRHLRYAKHLLTPSLGSLTIVIIAATLILGVANWAYGARSGIIYNYMLGPNSAPDLIESSKSTIAAIDETVFGNPLLNKALFFAFWLLIGIIVYILVTGIGRYFGGLVEYWQQQSYVHSNKEDIKRQFIVRALLRTVALLSLFFYSVFFFNVFLPFSILASRIGFSSLDELGGWVYGGIALLELLLCMHFFVILLRFAALRPRLFGSLEADEKMER